MSLTLGEVESR